MGYAPEAGAVVTEFCAAWSTGDVDRLTSYFAEDAVYHNVPLHEIRGIGNIRRGIEAFLSAADRVTFEIRSQLVVGDRVMNERVDTFLVGGEEIVVPAAGVFRISDSRIALWRDYFDAGQAARLLGERG